MKTSSAALAIAITAASCSKSEAFCTFEAECRCNNETKYGEGYWDPECCPEDATGWRYLTFEFPSCATTLTPYQRLLVGAEGSVVHYANGTNTLIREEVADAVQLALDGENDAELVELFQKDNVTMVFSLESNDMGVLAPDGLDGEFGIQNAFVKDTPEIVYRVLCPVKSEGAVCDVKEYIPALKNVCEFQGEDIPSKCMNQMYSVGLYAYKAPHFFLGATAQGEVQDKDCLKFIGFESIRHEKKKLGLLNTTAIKELDETPVHMLGSRELGAILEAEEQAESRDFAEFDLETNTCAHYAGSISRNLGFEETDELAEFIIDHVLNDENFERIALQYSSGIRRLAANAIGAKRVFGAYFKNIVYSHFEL